MIKLYGFPASNYFNMVKLALIEKGAAYEDVRVFTGQSEDMLAKSPMGKVPFVETEHGFLSETSVILDYIDETQAGPSFYPSDPFEKSRVRELIKFTELYLELPARRCHGQAFFGAGPTPDLTKDEVRVVMERGVGALRRHAVFSPYLAGETLSYADMVFLYTFPLARSVAQRVLDWDLSAELPSAHALIEELRTRPAVKTVDEDALAGQEEFRKHYGMK
ncbi:MAG: glutathione S-transferase [Pseudomonadota bacterium]